MFPSIQLQRRQLLQLGLAGASYLTGSIALASVRRPQVTPRARACILLYMDGGPSHIDMWDMKPNAADSVRGPFRPVASSVTGTQVSELLPLTAQRMHHLVQIRSVRHSARIHDPAVYHMLTGYPHPIAGGGLKVNDERDFPQMGTAFGYFDRGPAVMPKVVQIPETMKMRERVLPGQHAGLLGRIYDPFSVEVTEQAEVTIPEFVLQSDVTTTRLENRVSLLGRLNRQLDERHKPNAATAQYQLFQRQAVEILGQPQIHSAFQLENETPNIRERYGRFRQGQSVLLARRLVEAGARFVTVYWGHEDQDRGDGKGPRHANNPWDTHRNHFPLLKDSLVPRADQTLSALLDDLHERGLLDETLVVWMGDFGRTPRINNQYASRDHWPGAFTVLMAGAGLHGGLVYGKTDRFAAEVIEDPVSPGDLTATIFDALGVEVSSQIRDAEGDTHLVSNGRSLLNILD